MEFGGGGSRKSSRDEKSKTRRVLPRVPSDVAPVLPQSSRSSSRRSSQAQDSSLDLTNVTDLSQTSVLEAGSIIGGAHPPRRDFVSPVKLVSAEDGVDSSVTVAVRVRPLSDREHRLGAQQVIRMHGNETIITSKSGVIHRFFYDHCFWSVDESSPQYAGQGVVYSRLAQPLLDWSFEGYNTCLFAYGQTGSGKSYCIMGEGENHGVVPQFAKELFERVEGTTDDETTFKIQVSYYEIYKEKIFDLLASTKHKSKTKLRVREHPVMGPYVEDLSTFVANSYSDIERWINLGNRFRATAATGMNDRSSRSHSVFTILLTQTSLLEGEEHSRVSRINLIDLAGSERSSAAQTSGERLKEGASINRSLHTLGKVISLLSDRSTGKRRKVYIPYRDSTITWLLKESLGGNSRTAMIATISPADTHYEESLSTLRYAQQARTIINVAKINEDPNARVIRDLRQEIDYLRSLVGGGGVDQGNMAELQQLREKLMESEKLMSEATRSWQEKLAQTEARKREEMDELKRSGALKVNNRLPNLVNLTDDPQLSEMLLYVLKEGVTTVGRQGGGALSQSYDIELKGALVMESHCIFVNDDSAVRIEPSASADAQTYVNGILITSPTNLQHGDRVVLGGEYYFRFNHPLRAGEEGSTYRKGQGTFEYAKNELIQAQTARLEAELEERRLREREELMAELQAMKDAAQVEMDRQRTDYEIRISQLSKDMEEQSMIVSLEQQSKLEARSKMDELLREKELLEEENMAQKHLIQLEKLKAEKEYAEMKEQKSRLMAELEQEKMKLEGDINKLQRNKQMRMESSKRESTVSLGGGGGGGGGTGEGTVLKGSELMRVAMMLQEASAICKGLNKPLIFTRDELVSEGGHVEVHIRVNNAQLGLVTYWDLAKFETRLDQMRDIYQAMPTPGSASSLDSDSINLSGGEDQGDPFNDPTDNWVKDSVITPLPSPHRTAQLRRSLLSSNSSPILSSPLYGKISSGSTAASGSAHSSCSLIELLSSALGSGSRTSSPAHLTPGSTHPIRSSFSYSHLSQSLPRLCSDNIGKLLSFKEDGLHHKVTMFQRMLDHTHKLRSASHSLEDLFDKYAPTPDLNLPFSVTSDVRAHSLSLYCGLELLLDSAKSLWEHCHTHPRLTTPTPICEMLSQQSCDQLLSTISQQTALYCSKLLQGVDHGVEDTIRESRSHLMESLEGVASLIGQLSLARRHYNGFITRTLATPTKREVFPEINDDFLSLEPYRQMSSLFYRGHCDWCSAVIDHASHMLQDSLQPLTRAPPHSPVVDEIVGAVKRVISATLTFLQTLSDMQASIWSVCEVGDGDEDSLSVGTLPPTPNLRHVTGMLVVVEHVHQGALTLTQLTAQLGNEEDPGEINSRLEKLSVSNSQVALCCNELAALLLTIIKSAPCTTSKELSSQVQTLSHDIARAGKNVNHLLKKRGVASSSSRRSSRATAQPNTAVATKITTATNLPAVENSRKRVSLTGPQPGGRGFDEKASVGERGSRRKSNVPHDGESRNTGSESIATISTAAEHMSNTDITPTISAGTTTTDLEKDRSSEKTSESTQNGYSSTTPAAASHNGDSNAGRETPAKTSPRAPAKTAPPLTTTEEAVSVRHSNATGQVISDSPTHSPPHHTSSQSSVAPAGNCLTSTAASSAVRDDPKAKAVVAQALADEDDCSVI